MTRTKDVSASAALIDQFNEFIGTCFHNPSPEDRKRALRLLIAGAVCANRRLDWLIPNAVVIDADDIVNAFLTLTTEIDEASAATGGLAATGQERMQ